MLSQVVLAGVPNVELVSILLMIYTLSFDLKLVIGALYTFVLLQGLLYGFGTWWIGYLYVWLLLVLVVKWCGPSRPLFLYALLSGVFGLLFGTLTSLPYMVVSGFTGALGYMLAGVPYDLLHAAGNFMLALLLFHPLKKGMERIKDAISM